MAYRTRILSHACLCHFRVYTTVTQLQEEVSWQRQLKSAIWVCFLILFSSLPLYDSISDMNAKTEKSSVVVWPAFQHIGWLQENKNDCYQLHDFRGGRRKAGRLTQTGTKLAYHLQSAVYLWRFRRRPGPLPLYCFLFWNPFYAFSLSAIQQRFYVCVKESLCFSLVCLSCWWERWTAARCSPCCLQRRAEWVCHLYVTRANQKEKLLNVVVMQKAPWWN